MLDWIHGEHAKDARRHTGDNKEDDDFFIGKHGKGTYRECEAWVNKDAGFEIEDGCTCSFTDCTSDGKKFTQSSQGKGFKI